MATRSTKTKKKANARAKASSKTALAATKKKSARAKKKKKPPVKPDYSKFSCFVIKSEPFVYSFDQLVADGKTSWEGVRNFEARNTLRGMKVGATLLYYHSNEGKEIVGVASVAKTAYQDPTTDEDWSTIDVTPVKRLAKPVDLATLKAHPVLKNMALVKRGRISVTPVTDAELAEVLTLANTKLDR